MQLLQLLLQGVNQVVLLLLLLLQLGHRLLRHVRRAPRHRDLVLHLLVVRLNLLQRAVQLVQLKLEFLHLATLHLCEREFFLRRRSEHLQVLIRLLSDLANDFVVVMGAFERHLQLRQLLLHAVEFHTYVFASLLGHPQVFATLTCSFLYVLLLLHQLRLQRGLSPRQQRVTGIQGGHRVVVRFIYPLNPVIVLILAFIGTITPGWRITPVRHLQRLPRLICGLP
mmetsp:Transcript_21916/g.41799  ORF Transcript_21916/g.41799 Transcript_21916/m.41799 type:complete len:225 (-) Transcript_21916:26-700(-)